jgi:Na+/melibiose symporter-like transporter
MSPSFVFSIFTLLVVIFYSWTLTFSTAITLGLIVSSPLFLLVIRPTWRGLRVLHKIKRNHLVEMLVVVTLSIAAFMGVQYLPFVAGTSALQIILLGLLPVFLHALISFAADLSERDLKEEAA